LMDVQMPEMNGLDAAGAIKRMLSDECPPIIAVTANASSQDKDSYLAAGIDDYLSKPLKGELLRAAIHRHRRRYTR
jgi:CheY-like chemotaxis protein